MMKSCLLWLSVLADLFRFMVLSLRSESSLAAENLFLRKQLGFYQERSIRPRRTSPPAQVTLILLSRWFNWRSALTVVTPRTFIGWQRKRSQLFWRNKCQAGRPRIPPDLQRLDPQDGAPKGKLQQSSLHPRGNTILLEFFRFFGAIKERGDALKGVH